jgi:hypothetical protein
MGVSRIVTPTFFHISYNTLHQNLQNPGKRNHMTSHYYSNGTDPISNWASNDWNPVRSRLLFLASRSDFQLREFRRGKKTQFRRYLTKEFAITLEFFSSIAVHNSLP